MSFMLFMVRISGGLALDPSTELSSCFTVAQV
jgi:hypothetical protein